MLVAESQCQSSDFGVLELTDFPKILLCVILFWSMAGVVGEARELSQTLFYISYNNKQKRQLFNSTLSSAQFRGKKRKRFG